MTLRPASARHALARSAAIALLGTATIAFAGVDYLYAQAPAQGQGGAQGQQQRQPQQRPAQQQQQRPAQQQGQQQQQRPAQQQQQQGQGAPQQGGAPQQQAQQQEMPPIVYSPWTKICPPKNPNDPNAKEVCITAKDAKLETGQPLAGAAIIDPQGEAKKILRITLPPIGLLVQPGTRVIVDQDKPLTAPYVICFVNGCASDYEITAETITRLKKAEVMTVQAISGNGQAFSLSMPMAAEFVKAIDGAATDPKAFEEQQKKLQEELQRRAEEARKRLEQQQGGAKTQ